MDADVLRDRAALRAYLDHVCPQLGLYPHHALFARLTDPVGNIFTQWFVDEGATDAVRTRMQRDGFPATRLQAEEVFGRRHVCDTP